MALVVSRVAWPISVVTSLVVVPMARPASFKSAQADVASNKGIIMSVALFIVMLILNLSS